MIDAPQAERVSAALAPLMAAVPTAPKVALPMAA
jgi:hypothetical protein